MIDWLCLCWNCCVCCFLRRIYATKWKQRYLVEHFLHNILLFTIRLTEKQEIAEHKLFSSPITIANLSIKIRCAERYRKETIVYTKRNHEFQYCFAEHVSLQKILILLAKHTFGVSALLEIHFYWRSVVAAVNPGYLLFART